MGKNKLKLVIGLTRLQTYIELCYLCPDHKLIYIIVVSNQEQDNTKSYRDLMTTPNIDVQVDQPT